MSGIINIIQYSFGLNQLDADTIIIDEAQKFYPFLCPAVDHHHPWFSLKSADFKSSNRKICTFIIIGLLHIQARCILAFPQLSGWWSRAVF